MKKVGFVAILGVVAVLAAYVWLEKTPQNPGSRGAEKLVHDVEQVTKNTKGKLQKAITTQSDIQGSVHSDFVKAGGGDGGQKANAEEIRAYEPTLEELSYVDDNGETHMLHVEVVSKPAEVQKGLMFRHELPEDQGMLFVFGQEGERSFWMKNTYIPLDMLFIRADGTVQSIHKNAVPLDTSIIHSGGPAQFVLEVNAGVADKLGAKAGDKLHNENFAN